MVNGTVKWFNNAKGYGFISPDSGDNDVFVHIKAVEAAGLRNLDTGQKVTYSVESHKGKEAASNIKLA